jgi:hypothetical protein
MGKPNKKDKKLRAGEESRDLDLERFRYFQASISTA